MNDWIDAEGHAARALEMYERGRWAEAESELRKAISLNPHQPEWQFNLGLTLEAAGRDADALSAYEHAVEMMPDQPDPMLMSGIVANRLGDHERAIAWFERVLAVEPTSELAYAHQIESHVRLHRHDDAEVVFYLAEQALPEPSGHCLAVMGESLLQRELFARAGWCLREALRLEPTLPRLRGRLGAVYAGLGESQKAVQMYLRELRDDPGNIDALLDYGELLMDLGRCPEAAEKFRRVLELEPANVDAHMRLGDLAMLMHRYEQAHVEYELVLKLDAEFPNVRLALAEALLRRGRTDDAARLLREQFEILQGAEVDAEVDPSRLGPLDTTDLPRLGGLLLDAGPADLAVRVFEQAISLVGAADVDLLRKLALARYQTGDRGGGTQISRRVLRLDPRCVRSMHNLALAALEEDNLATAGAWIRRGLGIDRHDEGLRRLRMKWWMAHVRRLVPRGRAD